MIKRISIHLHRQINHQIIYTYNNLMSKSK